MHVFILLTCLLLLMGCASGLGKIAYVQDGDIWVKELPNGEPKRIATEGDRPLVPRWSPSGQWLLFRDDFTYRRFGVVKGNERQIRLLDDGAPIEDVVWAPGDDRLAYLYYDVELSNKSLVVANADGTKSKGFGKGGGEHGGGFFWGAQSLAWSPDGKHLAYVYAEDRCGLEYAALWVISADGGEAKELLNAGSRAAYMPTLAGWSPDGQHILFWRDSYFVNTAHGGIGNPDPADTNRLYKISIVNSSLSPLAEGVIGYPPFVVPGPRAEDEVVVVAGIPGAYCGNLTSTWTSKKLHLISAAYGEGSAFTPEDMAASSPQWSPDGARLAFVGMPDQGCRYCDNNVVLDSSMKRHIWMANTHGMPELIQLTSDPAYRDEYPIWSADGSHLLFARLTPEEGSRRAQVSLWLLKVASGELRRVVDNVSPVRTQWEWLFAWWPGSSK